MKTVTTAMLVVTLLIVVGCRTQENASKETGQPSKPPDVSLHEAALQGNIDAVRQHIKAGSDLNEKDAYGSSPLIVAVLFRLSPPPDWFLPRPNTDPARRAEAPSTSC